jgi:hypothetical protein
MKKTSKKLFGGFMIAMLIATIGAVIASAATVETSEDDTEQTLFWSRRPMFGPGPFYSELTDEQREDLQATIQQKFEEYGIEMPTRDEILEKQIERAEKRLEILNRQKELREEGYEWEEIHEIIQDEFELDFPAEGQHMQFKHGHCRGFRGFMASENSD